MSKSLYRTEVVREQSRASLGRILLIRPLSFAFLTAAAAGLVAVVLAFLALGEYSRKAPVAGVL
ncbi:MAG TPA: secretion protein, partial [Usitatibacteraceae bacterium]|nr:secretion protein [Usitatibacteraceae bacterium]